MRCAFVLTVVAAFIATASVGCTAREVLSGAAGAGAGYVVGKETSDDD